MKITMQTLLLWSPRCLGIAVALFVGVFALDAVEDGSVALLVHLTPTLLLLALVAVAWRHEWVGAAGFITLALLYATSVWPRVDWMLVLAVPGLVVGTLFLWSWRYHDELHAAN